MSDSSGQIPVDDTYSTYETEDAYQHGDSGSYSSGRTLATTTTMYRQENGRTYHAYRDGEYWQPNDEKQNNHEAIVHHLCIMTLQDRLFLAPIEDPKNILDLGTGTGIWATDIADKFPSATVTGTDLSPIQPGMQPPNCHFEIDDMVSTWVYPPSHFDFIHIRGLFGSIADWSALYRQCYTHMQPGGWLEQVEWSIHNRSADGTLGKEQKLRQWSGNAVRIAELTGKTFEIAEGMAGLIGEAGFEGVVEKRFKWPIGPWSSDKRLKEIGRWNLLNWEEGMEGWCMAPYTRVLGWTPTQVQDWLASIRKALRDRKAHVYHEVRLVYARKPLDTDQPFREEKTNGHSSNGEHTNGAHSNGEQGTAEQATSPLTSAEAPTSVLEPAASTSYQA